MANTLAEQPDSLADSPHGLRPLGAPRDDGTDQRLALAKASERPLRHASHLMQGGKGGTRPIQGPQGHMVTGAIPTPVPRPGRHVRKFQTRRTFSPLVVASILVSFQKSQRSSNTSRLRQWNAGTPLERLKGSAAAVEMVFWGRVGG